MKIKPLRIAVSSALATAFTWTLCSAVVVMFPVSMMDMTGHMLHSDFQHMAWTMTFSGFLIGMITWSLCVGLFAWILSVIYNNLPN